MIKLKTPEERALWKAIAVAVAGRASDPESWADRVVGEFRERLTDQPSQHPYREQ